jgi:hypothetical protein
VCSRVRSKTVDVIVLTKLSPVKKGKDKAEKATVKDEEVVHECV